MKINVNISPIRRAFYLGISALFVTFLVYSTPHRVHHLFDQFQTSDHQHSADHHSRPERGPGDSASTCVFQSVAGRCHANVTALVQFSAVSVFVKTLADANESPGYHRFLPNAFQIRAPPRA